MNLYWDSFADFIAAATPRTGGGQQADERCASLSIRANGVRSATDSRGADSTFRCWG